ncbi:Cd2+/Zn2+-exporting ATPase [Sporobacter termitidis DSM 10068]|uniref:Cd(2+)-exporting ATPase n=1 Tax=Sporobacter termitidis DSM 10068 TaxID=1123282 RepID=A0A1M5X231_9FIRM|nr:heavy metal translocating P-type ATPase [Sporobacter termitidis]SHH93263.1 Cd2+/Zn2+-exporting ATPase [Sporobacter termitidis DSM 10068]
MSMENDRDQLKKPRPALPPDFLLLMCLAVSAVLLAVGLFVHVAAWLKIFIFASSVVLAGYDVAVDTVVKIVREHDFDESFLVVIAAIGVFLIGREAEGAAVMLLFRVGEVVRDKAAKRLKSSIEGFVDLRPDEVNAVVSGAIVRKAAGKIREGDVISVAPGERFALDGVVVSGVSEVDASALTGSSVRRTVREGSEVLSGCLNLTGTLDIRATCEFDGTTVSRLLKFVEKDESKKARPEKKIARFAGIFTPTVIAATLVVGVLVPLFGGFDFRPWLSRAFGFLAVSGASALVISITLTYFAGIGGAAKKGILFKGASIVDAAAHATSVVFDKTGTLTTGSYQVADIQSYNIPADQLLMLGAYAEAYSRHPMARAIIAEAGFTPDYDRISNYREISGKGTEVDISGMTVTAGNALMMEELGITPDIAENDASVVYIAVSGKYAGRILLRDTIRPDAKRTVRDLHNIGIDRIAMFTGDKKSAAGEIASQLGILEFYAEYQVEDKLKRLRGLNEMQLPGDKLIFIGDGASDVPVLRLADVGAAIGGLGSDEAADAAGMVIMTDEPSKITEAIKLARTTDKIVGQNITVSLVLKGLVLLLVALGLATAWVAVLADAVVSVLAVLNAMRAFGLGRRAFINGPEEEDGV